MEDIRLLKLFKQHYQDRFNEPLHTKYSSWGYYDGFEISKPTNSSVSILFSPETEASFSSLYYGTGAEISNLSVGKSQQIIGLIKHIDDSNASRIADFWQMADKLPYFAVGFLKVTNENFMSVSEQIEKTYNSPFNPAKEKGCFSLAYLTYDNADLIILMTGNSITYMMNVLSKIENSSQISYMHNIFGVTEKMLAFSKHQGVIPLTLNDVCFHIEEEIECIEMKFVTSGNNNQILKGLKNVLDQENGIWTIKNYEQIKYSYVSGHENLIIKLNKTNVRSLLILLTPNGFLTHQNIMYENGVYNIETSISVEEKNWTNIPSISPPLPLEKREKDAKIWCRHLIKKYSQYITIELEQGDEGFYSYFQSLILTLNTLNQYERFHISKDVFLMVYPALNLFDKIFSDAYNTLKSNSCHNSRQITQLKDVLCSFITHVNSVIYHTIHTDQVFLMIPGYSGTSYSIPIKLNMLFYWFIDAIKEILNDGCINCQCILVPDLETYPKSNLFDFGIETEDRLIRIYFSQRTLFLPKNLMIILAHEMGHYIGRDIRMREKRLEYLRNTISKLIIQRIICNLNTPKNQNLKNIFDSYKETVSQKMEDIISDFLSQYCNSNLQEDYHGISISDTLKKGIAQLLTLKNGGIEKIIMTLPDNLEEKLKDNENFHQYSKYIWELQQAMLNALREMSYSQCLDGVIDKLLRTYREVFSDIVSVAITNCNFYDFCEAHQVSEGILISEENIPDIQCMRELTVNEVIYGKKYKIHLHGFGEKNETPYIENNLYSYPWVREDIIQYANDCYQAITKRLGQTVFQPVINEIRDLFLNFKDKKADNINIQQKIMKIIGQYMEKGEMKR